MKTSTLVVIYDELEKNQVLVILNPSQAMVERIEAIRGTYMNSDALTDDQKATHLYLQGYTKDGESDDTAEKDGWERVEDVASMTFNQGPVQVVMAGCAY